MSEWWGEGGRSCWIFLLGFLDFLESQEIQIEREIRSQKRRREPELEKQPGFLHPPARSRFLPTVTLWSRRQLMLDADVLEVTPRCLGGCCSIELFLFSASNGADL